MKHSEILKQVKDELWDGKGDPYSKEVWKTRYICLLLTGRGYLQKTKSNQIKAYIKRLLKQSDFKSRFAIDSKGIEGWLNLQGIYPKNTVEMQKYRARFVDELIRRYEEVGK